MRHKLGLVAFALLSVTDVRAQTVPEIRFESAANPLKLPPNLYFGEVTGVALNSKRHVFVFSRANTAGPAYGAAAAQLLEFAPDGSFIREIGHNLYAWASAHTVKIDAHDNIWVTDKGSDMVVEFDPQGRVIMVVGRKQESSDPTGPLPHPNPPLPPVMGMFRQVTDMTWDAADNTYISDGYINSRVVKLDRNGDWIMSWGEPGSGPGQFSVPHSIASDAAGKIYVADRGNRRIQVFDGDGKFLRQITIDLPPPPDAKRVFGPSPRPPAAPATTASAVPAGPGSIGPTGTGTQMPGSPWAICITPGPVQYIYAADAYPGRIYKLSLDGQLLGWLGSTGKTLGKFAWIHELACPSENELWVADLLNWRVQKLTLHPVPR